MLLKRVRSSSYLRGLTSFITLSKSSVVIGTNINYVDHFKEFVTDCYFTVTLTEETSGITKTIKIRFDDSIVTGVGITSGELLF